MEKIQVQKDLAKPEEDKVSNASSRRKDSKSPNRKNKISPAKVKKKITKLKETESKAEGKHDDHHHHHTHHHPCEDHVNLVYNIERYLEENSPMCVYIPSKLVLLKMMRACLGIERVEDLWIYHKDHSSNRQNYQAQDGENPDGNTHM